MPYYYLTWYELTLFCKSDVKVLIQYASDNDSAENLPKLL